MELDKKTDAKKHLADAINFEDKFQNIHTYDKLRHEQYKALMSEWK